MPGKLCTKCFVSVLLIFITFCSFSDRVRADAGSYAASGVTDVIDQVADAAGDLYEQMDEAIDNFDAESLKGQIRLALEQMDQMGISPTSIARERFGIKANPTSGLATGITGEIVESAGRAVREESQGPLQDLFDRILGGVSDFVAAVAALIGKYLPLPF